MSGGPHGDSPMKSNTARLRRASAAPVLWIPLPFVALPVLWALLPGGMPNTADGLVHYTRASEMVHAWQDGVLIPRWSENLGLGYGIPLFVYAPPLPYYLTAASAHAVRLAPGRGLQGHDGRWRCRSRPTAPTT